MGRNSHSRIKNHYVPEFILKYWYNSRGLVELSPYSPIMKGLETAPTNICAQRGIYFQHIEAKLSELESIVAPRWEQLFWEFGNNSTKKILALFLAVQWRRGPMERMQCADIKERLFNFAKEHMPATFLKDQIGFDLFNDQISNGTHEIALDFLAKQWTVLNFRGIPVLEICDHPVIMTHPEATTYGSRSKGTMTFFPATPSIGLLMTDPDEKGDRIEFMHPKFAERLNTFTRWNASQFLITPPTK
jgi:hypothetical protein